MRLCRPRSSSKGRLIRDRPESIAAGVPVLAAVGAPSEPRRRARARVQPRRWSDSSWGPLQCLFGADRLAKAHRPVPDNRFVLSVLATRPLVRAAILATYILLVEWTRAPAAIASRMQSDCWSSVSRPGAHRRVGPVRRLGLARHTSAENPGRPSARRGASIPAAARASAGDPAASLPFPPLSCRSARRSRSAVRCMRARKSSEEAPVRDHRQHGPVDRRARAVTSRPSFCSRSAPRACCSVCGGGRAKTWSARSSATSSLTWPCEAHGSRRVCGRGLSGRGMDGGTWFLRRVHSPTALPLRVPADPLRRQPAAHLRPPRHQGHCGVSDANVAFTDDAQVLIDFLPGAFDVTGKTSVSVDIQACQPVPEAAGTDLRHQLLRDHGRRTVVRRRPW